MIPNVAAGTVNCANVNSVNLLGLQNVANVSPYGQGTEAAGMGDYMVANWYVPHSAAIDIHVPYRYSRYASRDLRRRSTA